MYYSVELFSLRRRGKLARCWLAATMSEKMFLKVCRRPFIRELDVFHTCDEILSSIVLREGRSYGRFSLYTSAQLMFGVTRILSYQTKLLEDDIFEMQRILFEADRHEEKLHAIPSEVPDVPALTAVFQNLELPEDLHLITEERYTTAMENLMQDGLNFGLLPAHELERFLLLETEEASLNDIRGFPWEDPTEIPGTLKQVPLTDINGFETEKEVQAAHARQYQPQHRIADEGEDARRSVPTTPRKRILKPPTESGTPTKRSKKGSPQALELAPQVQQEQELLPIEVQLQEEAVPIEVQLQEAPLLIEGQQRLPSPEVQQQQPEEENIGTVEKSVPRSRKIVDKQTQISDAHMRKNISNVRAHTVEQHLYRSGYPSAKKYLKQPSTDVFRKLWGKTLTGHFNRYLVKLSGVPNVFDDVPDFDEADITTGEMVRADISRTLQDQTNELSSKLGITAIDTTTEQTYETIEQMPPAVSEDIAMQEPKELQEESEEFLPKLPGVTSFVDKIGEGIAPPEESSDKQEEKKLSNSGSSSSSKAHLTKKELLALMEISWKEQRLIKFEDVISPECYNRDDAVLAFHYCLELHAEKLIILKQAEPFDSIWIEKYELDSEREYSCS